MDAQAGGARTNGHLSKEQLFQNLAVREEDYTLPTGGTIRIRGLPVDEGMTAIATMGDEQSAADERVKRICLLGIVDPKLEPEDMEAMGKLSANALSDVAVAIIRLSGLVTEDVETFLETTRQPKRSSSTARKSSAASRQK